MSTSNFADDCTSYPPTPPISVPNQCHRCGAPTPVTAPTRPDVSRFATITGSYPVAGIGLVLILEPHEKPFINFTFDGLAFSTGLKQFLRPLAFMEGFPDPRATHVLVVHESEGQCVRHAVRCELPPELMP
jgi:hypothetical protein